MNTKKHTSLRLTEFPWHYISTVCDLLLLFFLMFPLSLVTSHFQYGLFFSPLSPVSLFLHFFFVPSLAWRTCGSCMYCRLWLTHSPFCRWLHFDICSVKPYCSALTQNRCSRPIYNKLRVNSFHLREQSGGLRDLLLSPPRPLLLLSLHFTLWILNCSSTPRIGSLPVLWVDAEQPWGLTFLAGSEVSSLFSF